MERALSGAPEAGPAAEGPRSSTAGAVTLRAPTGARPRSEHQTSEIPYAVARWLALDLKSPLRASIQRFRQCRRGEGERSTLDASEFHETWIARATRRLHHPATTGCEFHPRRSVA